MRSLGCARAADTREAAAGGRWTDDLQQHLATCDVCTEVASITGLLADDPPLSARSTSPAILWARARHARRMRAEAAAARIITGTQIVAGLIGLAALGFLAGQFEGAAVTGNSPVALTTVAAVAGFVTLASVVVSRWLTGRA